MYSKNKKSKKIKNTKKPKKFKNPKKYFFYFYRKGGGKGEPMVPPIKLKCFYTINLKTQNKQLLNT